MMYIHDITWFHTVQTLVAERATKHCVELMRRRLVIINVVWRGFICDCLIIEYPVHNAGYNCVAGGGPYDPRRPGAPILQGVVPPPPVSLPFASSGVFPLLPHERQHQRGRGSIGRSSIDFCRLCVGCVFALLCVFAPCLRAVRIRAVRIRFT